jgi:hypothetical protein
MRLHLYEAGVSYHWSQVARWTFDQASDAVVPDSSGNDLHGRLVGDAQVVKDGDRPTRVLRLDGDGDWVDCGNKPMLNIVSEVTVAYWMKIERFDKRYQAVISKGENAWAIARFLDSDNLVVQCPSLAVADSLDGQVTGETDVNDGRWHHVAAVYSGTAVYLYVDGALDGSSEASGRIHCSPWNLLIGQDDFEKTNYGQDRSFKGLLDDVRIYSYALPEAEIMALYTGQASDERER